MIVSKLLRYGRVDRSLELRGHIKQFALRLSCGTANFVLPVRKAAPELGRDVEHAPSPRLSFHLTSNCASLAGVDLAGFVRPPRAAPCTNGGCRPPSRERARLTQPSVSVYTFRILRVCLQQTADSKERQQPLDSGTTARRTFAVVQIHSKVNRLEHSNRGFPVHRPYFCYRLPPAPRPAPARTATC